MTESIKSAERTGRHLTDCDGKSGHIIENVDIKLAGIYHPFSAQKSNIFISLPKYSFSLSAKPIHIHDQHCFPK